MVSLLHAHLVVVLWTVIEKEMFLPTTLMNCFLGHRLHTDFQERCPDCFMSYRLSVISSTLPRLCLAGVPSLTFSAVAIQSLSTKAEGWGLMLTLSAYSVKKCILSSCNLAPRSSSPHNSFSHSHYPSSSSTSPAQPSQSILRHACSLL